MPIDKNKIIDSKKETEEVSKAISNFLRKSKLAFTAEEIVGQLFKDYGPEDQKNIEAYIFITNLREEGVISGKNPADGKTYYCM